MENRSHYIIARYILIVVFIKFLSLKYVVNVSQDILSRVIYIILGQFYCIKFDSNAIIYKDFTLVIAKECVAIEAYVLIIILILSTPVKTLIQNLKYILLSFFALSLFNILRIIFLIVLLINTSLSVFDRIHLLLYEFLNGLFIALLLGYIYKRNKIEGKPFVTDIKFIINRMRSKSNK